MGLFDKTQKSKQLASDVNCPHCSTPLKPIPKRKKQCPSCGKDVYVRTDPFKRVKILVKQSDALSIDVLATLGFTEKGYRTTEEELTRNFKGVTPSISDVVWSIITKNQLAAAKKGDWQQLKMLYWSQAKLLHDLGKDCFRLLQETAKCELHAYEAMGAKKVEILTPPKTTCSKCQSLNGKVFTIKEALEVMPIPVKDCEIGLCQCIYLSKR